MSEIKDTVAGACRQALKTGKPVPFQVENEGAMYVALSTPVRAQFRLMEGTVEGRLLLLGTVAQIAAVIVRRIKAASKT